MNYDEFLHTKVQVAPVSGFQCQPEELSICLKPHQRDAVIWALKGGRRALFESFGLGKTIQELEWCRIEWLQQPAENPVKWSKPGPCPVTPEQFDAIYNDEEETT